MLCDWTENADNGIFHPCGHYWDYHPGVVSLNPFLATHLKIEHPWISSTGIRSSNELQWLDHVAGYQRLYSLSGKTSYRQISWSLEATRLDVIIIVSLWNVTDISAANFRAIGNVWTRFSRLRDFMRSRPSAYSSPWNDRHVVCPCSVVSPKIHANLIFICRRTAPVHTWMPDGAYWHW